MGFDHLSIRCSHQKCLASMQHTRFAECRSRRRLSGIDSLSCCLYGYKLNVLVVEEMVESTRRVASSAHTRKDVVRVRMTKLILQLTANFFADNTLKTRYHVGVRMRSNHRTYDVVCVRRIVDPMTHGFIGRIFEGHAATRRRYYLGAKNAHTLYVESLSLHVNFPHINNALHTHECTHGSSSHPVLTCTGLGNDLLLA